MYTYIIGLDDELWDILEDDIRFQVNGARTVLIGSLSLLIRKRYIENIIE